MTDHLAQPGMNHNAGHIPAEGILAGQPNYTASWISRNATARVTCFPDPADTLQHWPVRIYTLGRFSIIIDGLQPEYGRKVPHRILDLLKALIAMGGRKVSCNRLAGLLWPDVDGDTARKSLDTTLYRLRKLIGHDQALVCTDGTLSLDPGLCWVDVWAFERLATQINRAMSDDGSKIDPASMQLICDQLSRLYQDHFLQQDDVNSWSVSMRERLRSKFVHHLVECGDYWEQRSEWKRALDCYRKGLDVDDLVEVFYQRMMVCYMEQDRSSEAMATYRRCRQILSVVLGLRPEPQTEWTYEKLKRARCIRQPA